MALLDRLFQRQAPLDADARFARVHAAFNDALPRLKAVGDPLLLSDIEVASDPNRLKAHYTTVNEHLSQVPDLAGGFGLDFACGNGLKTYMMRLMGAGRLAACDMHAPYVNNARAVAAALRLSNVEIAVNPIDSVPFADARFDWVTAIGLYANLDPAATGKLFAEIHRVIRPGGLFLTNDSVNPHHPDILAHLRERHRRAEIGDGTPERPSGMAFQSRLDFLRRHAGDLDAEKRHAIALGTCYLWGDGILAAIRDYRRTGKPPQSHFREGGIDPPPMLADRGHAFGRKTDPLKMREELETAGFTVKFRASGKDVADSGMKAFLETHKSFFIVAEKPC